MDTDFAAITDDFERDLDAIRSLVDAFRDSSTGAAKIRISAANAATLLLAATFEEFVRSMARSYAKQVVIARGSFSRLPQRLATTAWRRAMRSLTNLRIDSSGGFSSSDGSSPDPRSRFDSIYRFCEGDLTQDIYGDLIYNENNMRPSEINALFNVSGLSDVCRMASDKDPLSKQLREEDASRSYSSLISILEGFFSRRNTIAHSLNSGNSSSPDEIGYDIDIFRAFGRSLRETLESA